MCNTWDRIRIQIWIGIKMESRIRIGIKTMPESTTLNNLSVIKVTCGKKAAFYYPVPCCSFYLSPKCSLCTGI
jgi:hypothetical protein